MLRLRQSYYVIPSLIFLGIGFALANGLGYGSGNLRQYLLHGLHAINPDLLANDWFTTHTQPHHSAFNRLIILLADAAPLDIAFACANAFFAMVFILSIYALARRYYRMPLLVTAVTALLIILIPRPYIGWTSIINNYFQPSTIGAVGLLVGLVCLTGERYKSAGVILLIAGVFHINYMVWSVVLVGLVVAINLNRIGVHRALQVVGPIALSVLYHLPFVVGSRSVEQTTDSAFAATILHDIYMPYHSRPLTWGMEPFIRFALLLLTGGIAVWIVPPKLRPNRMTMTVLAALGLIVVVGILFTTVIPIDTVALIFPYRLAPFLILASQIAVAGALVRSAQIPVLSTPKTLLLWCVFGAVLYACGVNSYGLSCLGVIATALLAGRLASATNLRWMSSGMILGGLIAGLYFGGCGKTGVVLIALFVIAGLAWKLARQQRWMDPTWPVVLPVGRLLIPLCIAAFLMRMGSVRKDLAGPPPEANEQVLYEWCRIRTDSGDVFIIPPGLAGFRLGAKRAVVVDWKCMPILPKDTIEWYRRLESICGCHFQSFDEAREGYRAMDLSRATTIAREYGARYLVTDHQTHNPELDPLLTVFANQTFQVYELGND